jgi:DUF4097 and DUF4098 domain-containing protein YvlB
MNSTVAVAVVFLAGAGAADAQDVRIETVIREQVLRQIQREIDRVETVVRQVDVTREVERAIESAMSNLDRSGAFAQGNQGKGGGDRRYPVSDSRPEKRTVAIGATGSLDLRNYGGNIVVTAGSGNEATIEIVRRARARTDADLKRAFEEVTVQVDHRGDRATVQVTDARPNDNRENYQMSVDYTVSAPAGTRLNIGSLGATVRVTGIKGDVAVEVAGGDISVSGSRVSRVKSMGGDITLTDVDAEGTLEVGTFGGDVLVERARARRLSAETMGGDLTARDVTADEAALKTMAGDVEFGGGLAKNGRYELRTHSGNVRVIVTGTAGFEIDATTFSGDIQPPAGLALKTTASTRRNLRGVVGDGGGRIIATTLSGDVIIVRK